MVPVTVAVPAETYQSSWVLRLSAFILSSSWLGAQVTTFLAVVADPEVTACQFLLPKLFNLERETFEYKHLLSFRKAGKVCLKGLLERFPRYDLDGEQCYAFETPCDPGHYGHDGRENSFRRCN